MANDDLEGIREPLAETTEHIKRRLHKHDGVMPLWLDRELKDYGRKCFARGVAHAHAARTLPRNPWADDEQTPLVYGFDDEATPSRDDGR